MENKFTEGMEIAEVEHVVAYILDITFRDGTKKRVDFSGSMKGERWEDMDKFIDELAYSCHCLYWGENPIEGIKIVFGLSIYEKQESQFE
jgi:hypothetical protein